MIVAIDITQTCFTQCVIFIEAVCYMLCLRTHNNKKKYNNNQRTEQQSDLIGSLAGSGSGYTGSFLCIPANFMLNLTI